MMPSPPGGLGQRKRRVVWPYVLGAIIVCLFFAMIMGPQIVIGWIVLSNHFESQERIEEKERQAKKGREGLSGDGTAAPTRSAEHEADNRRQEVSLDGMDPRRASVPRMMEKGAEAMKRVSPEARFESVNVRGASAGETVDLTNGASFTMGYTLHSIDRSKPPGKDVTTARFAINAEARACSDAKAACLRIARLDVPVPDPRPVPLPACGYGAMWKAALASGLPTNAMASVTYSHSIGEEGGSWLLRVPGHGDLARSIDGVNCRTTKLRLDD
jgi:hypothetical protein